MKAPIVAVLLSLASSAPVLAGTFVYVSNAEDGDIGMYTLQADGSLQPGPRFKATATRVLAFGLQKSAVVRLSAASKTVCDVPMGAGIKWLQCE